jgi:hypothetical protein
MKYIIIFFISLIFPFTFYGQLNTVVINYSKKQGAFKDCGLSSCTYFESTGDEILYSDGTGGQSDTKNARYLFEHPGFTNDKIKKIILEISINKIFQSTTLDAGMFIKMPNNSSNTAIPWSGFINAESLYNCNQNGNSIFQNGIGTGNTSSTTFYLSIYDQNSSGFIGQTLSYFVPNSDSFTFSFDPYVGGIQINSAKVHITYEGTGGGNELPSTPSLTASSNSTSSIKLNWTSIANATSYQVFDCNNQQVTTTTSTNYTVTGLNSGTTYGYKVKALNNNGSSSFSGCGYATTISSNGGGCSSTINNVTPQVSGYSQYSGIVKYTWSPVSQANSYQVYRCETNELLEETTLTEFTYKHELLKPGESFSIKIKAIDYCNNGGAYLSKLSNCSAVHTVKCISDISDYNFSSSMSYTGAAISWSHVYPSGYYLYQIFDCATNQIIATTYENRYTFSNLQKGTKYSYKIRTKGCDSSEFSAFSDCYEFETLGCKDNIAVTNETISSLKNYRAYSIEISETIFEANSKSLVEAGNQITILPNTHFKNGSDINLKIVECPSIRRKFIDNNIASINKENIFEKNDLTYSQINDNILYEYKFNPQTNESNIIVYPNPSNDYLNIKIPKEFSGGELALCNVSNQVLWRKDKVNTEFEIISVKQFPSGIYFLRATIADKTVIIKVIKK